MKKKYAFIIVGLLAVGGVAYLFYTHIQASRMQALLLARQQSIQAVWSNDPAMAIQQADQAVALAQSGGNVNAVASAQLLLAGVLFGTGQANNRQTASQLVKGVIANAQVDAYERAIAYAQLVNWLYLTRNDQVMKDYVFDTPPYDGYLNAAQGDVAEASVQLLGRANSLFPTAYAYNAMAYFTALQLMKATADPSNATQMRVAQTVRQYLTAADALPLVRGTAISQVTSRVIAFRMKAAAEFAIVPFFKDMSYAQVYSTYDRAIAFSTLSTTPAVQYWRALVELDYASALNRGEPGKHITQINELLSSVIQSNMLDSLLKNMGARQASDSSRQHVLAVAAISPSFAAYLKGLGWQI